MDNTMNEPTPSSPTPGGGSGKMIGIISTVVIIVLIIGVGFMFAQDEEATQPATNEAAEDTSEIIIDDESGYEEQVMGLSPDLPTVRSLEDDQIEGIGEGDVKEFTVTATNFQLSPAEMRVKQGDTVRVTYKNANGTHDWRLDEFGVATKVLQGDQEETVEFVADQVGEFEYYCSVGNHRQMGMVGKLIVE